MAAEVWEKPKSRSGKDGPADGRQGPEDPNVSLVYGVIGTDDETVADAAIDANAPLFYLELTRQYWQREFIGGIGAKGLWEYTVYYDRKETKGTGSRQFSFDITGGTQHITQSKETRESKAYFNSPNPAPNCQGAIGVTDNSIDGCDIVIPKMEFTFTAIESKDNLPTDFIDRLKAAVGMVNDADWTISYQGQDITFEAADVLFHGGPISFRGDGDWEFVLKFSASPTVRAKNIGTDTNPIVINEKRGWDYLWVKYKDKQDAGSKTFTRIPHAAYVERVYDAINFDSLFLELFL